MPSDSSSARISQHLRWGTPLFALGLSLLFAFLPYRCSALAKDKVAYGEGLILNLPLPEPEVEQAVQDVAQNGIIRGTKEYNKDQFVSGAITDSSSTVFPEWTEGGKVFYKLRMHAIDPINFKDANDSGTLVVRYVVQPQGDKNTLLRIDALYREDFRHTLHPSNGSVESSEYKDIREHLDAVELMKQQTVQAVNQRNEKLARQQALAAGAPLPVQSSSSRATSDAETANPEAVNSATPLSRSPEEAVPASSSEPAVAQPAAQTLEQRLQDLRKQVERLVKAPGAPLKSAPFHTASTLQLMSPGSEVLIVVSTPYWYGVETHEGLHGWMMRDELELP
jgi:polyhydroxyalkanoate synthesis regulator phasin